MPNKHISNAWKLDKLPKFLSYIWKILGISPEVFEIELCCREQNEYVVRNDDLSNNIDMRK